MNRLNRECCEIARGLARSHLCYDSTATENEDIVIVTWKRDGRGFGIVERLSLYSREAMVDLIEEASDEV